MDLRHAPFEPLFLEHHLHYGSLAIFGLILPSYNLHDLNAIFYHTLHLLLQQEQSFFLEFVYHMVQDPQQG
jgi:hypothetical protein